MQSNDRIVGIASGLITGTITCALFYWLGGRDLRREAGDLRRLDILTIRALAQAGLAEVNLDESGNPLGLVYRFEASGGFRLGGRADATVQPNPPEGGAVALGGTALAEVVRATNPDPPIS